MENPMALNAPSEVPHVRAEYCDVAPGDDISGGATWAHCRNNFNDCRTYAEWVREAEEAALAASYCAAPAPLEGMGYVTVKVGRPWCTNTAILPAKPPRPPLVQGASFSRRRR
jgi:hypothetical protein